MKVILHGLVVEGKDGNHHDRDCCKLPMPWNTEEKGLNKPRFLKIDIINLSIIPIPGDIINLKCGDSKQDVSVIERCINLDDTIDIWIGGWTHWSTKSVVELFRENGGDFY